MMLRLCLQVVEPTSQLRVVTLLPRDILMPTPIVQNVCGLSASLQATEWESHSSNPQHEIFSEKKLNIETRFIYIYIFLADMLDYQFFEHIQVSHK